MMGKGKKHIELLEYINNPLSIESMNLLYSANNICIEKVQVCSDFTLSLIQLIFDTYLGDDITNDEDKEKHFNWCWDTTLKNFKRENINLTMDGELKTYFLDFMSLTYYQHENKSGESTITHNINKLWVELFDMGGVKPRAEVDTFLEVYRLFNEAIIH